MTDHPVKRRKKLIEVAIPLEAINAASAREKSIRHGHPSTLHLWWARRPLAAARAVIFCQMVDDPSAVPEEFPTEEAQENERLRLFALISELVTWENTTNEEVLNRAREEIRRSWRRCCADNADHPESAELFNPEKLPGFHDPFAGGGALPLEAQRLGLEAYASDLNPVAVLINKAMIEIPPKFAGMPPVNPASRRNLNVQHWKGAQGLAEDVRYYGQWMRDEAEKRIGHLYPKVAVTVEMAQERSDLKPYVDQELTVIAWLWARTVKSPNPTFLDVDVPLASTFMLCTKAGKEAYVEPVIENNGYRFAVKLGKPIDAQKAQNGTKLSRGANFECLMSKTPITGDYIKAEGKAGRMGARLMAIVAEGSRGRVYLSPTQEHETVAHNAQPEWKPEVTISGSTQYLGVKPYGMNSFDQLFTTRQLVALTTLSDLVQEARKRVQQDVIAAGLPSNTKSQYDEDTIANSYADAVTVCMSMCVSRQANRSATLNIWDQKGQNVQQVFGMQALRMTWDFVEGNPFSNSTGNFNGQFEYFTKVLEHSCSGLSPGKVTQSDAQAQVISSRKVISTDPPYYDNVPYADLSDFFYVWLRRSLRSVIPELFALLGVPKAEELVAFSYRHDSKEDAEAFFLEGMANAMNRLAVQKHPAFPVTIYYAFRQAESVMGEGTASTGWETFLGSIVRAGLEISGTWPVRTEYTGNLKTKRNALASSIVLACRKRQATAPVISRSDFRRTLRLELPIALAELEAANIAPVDVAQASIGPGMAIFSRAKVVLNPDDSSMTVRDALKEINTALDEYLSQDEGHLDADSRFALTFFESYDYEERSYGDAEGLAIARNLSVDGVVEAGILYSVAGKVRLIQRAQLPDDWDPTSDKRLCVWEATQHLIKRLEASGEGSAAELLLQLKSISGHGDLAANCRALAYRLYNHCEKTKQADEARAYNGLVIAWPELERLTATQSTETAVQTSLI
jgi:putative DNA methylase